MKQTNLKTVSVYKDYECLTGNLKKAIQTLQNFLDSTPEEYKDSAKMCFYQACEDENVERVIYYTREYTEEEKRLLEENIARRLEATKENNRKLFERLKSQYGW